MLHARREQPEPVRGAEGAGFDFQPDGLGVSGKGEGEAVQRLKARALRLHLGKTQLRGLVQQDRPVLLGDLLRRSRHLQTQEQADDESCGDPEPAHSGVPSMSDAPIIAMAYAQKAAMPAAFLGSLPHLYHAAGRESA